MSDWKTYINKEGSSNKFWKFRYSDDGCSVEKEWGRIGGRADSQSKSFGSHSQAQRYANGEVVKKIRKGYTEASDENLQEETEVAQTIGTRWKIDRIEFLNGSFDPGAYSQTLAIGDDYNPECGVYVELLESWNKTRVHMLLTKSQAVQYRSGSARGNTVNVSNRAYLNHSFVEGIRKAIRQLAEVVEKIVTINFAAVGARVLDLDGTAESKAPEEFQLAISAAAAKSGASTQAVSKFAAMGRSLEI